MKILVFDTETTGLPAKDATIYESKKWPYIIQLSYILYDTNTNEVIIKDNYIKISDSIEISSGSFEKHKITREILDAKGISIVDALNEFNDYVGISDIVVGHNISFDKRMIFVECLRNKIDQNFTVFDNNSNKICKNEYCTMNNTKQYCNILIPSRYGEKKTFLKNPSLVELYGKLFPDAGIPDNLHNSLVDILITFRCYMSFVYKIDIVLENDYVQSLFISLGCI